MGYPLIVTAAVITNGKNVLVAQRQGGHLAGKWEFPGGKLESGESPEECLTREIREELGIEVQVEGIFEVVYHKYDFGPILLLAYSCKILDKCEIRRDNVKWLSIEELAAVDFAPADIPIVRKLLKIKKH